MNGGIGVGHIVAWCEGYLQACERGWEHVYAPIKSILGCVSRFSLCTSCVKSWNSVW